MHVPEKSLMAHSVNTVTRLRAHPYIRCYLPMAVWTWIPSALSCRLTVMMTILSVCLVKTTEDYENSELCVKTSCQAIGLFATRHGLSDVARTGAPC